MSMIRQGHEAIKGSKCQDCGNQAKKDCAYSRCRTCCKNKGFVCQTHIRSSWIPVDRRRHREEEQHPSHTTNNKPHHLQQDVPKRHKHNPFSGSEELKFPPAVSCMAIFNCVRVRSMDDTVNEVAYQASVNLGGHVFSGLLYDQGPQQSSRDHPLDQQQHNLNLMTAPIHDGATTMAPLSVTAAHETFFPPPYPFPLASSFRPGMPYFSHPKP